MAEEEKGDPRKPEVVTDYQGNSLKSRTQEPGKPKGKTEKKIDPVVKSATKIQKKSFVARVKKGVDDWDIPGVIRHAYHEVAIPAAQNLFYDTIVDAIGRVTFKHGGRRYPGPHGGSMITYGGRVNRDPREPRDRDPRTAPRPTQGPRGRRMADNVIFDTRGEAQDVLDGLNDVLLEYDFVTVGDLYELLGRPQDANPVDWKWGWVVAVDAPITQTRDGFMLDLPPVGPIDR